MFFIVSRPEEDTVNTREIDSKEIKKEKYTRPTLTRHERLTDVTAGGSPT